jgi:hypothetical protein
LPLLFVFMILLYLGREHLGIKWILALIGIWAVLFIGLPALRPLPYYFFISAHTLLGVILVIVVFKGDMKLW